MFPALSVINSLATLFIYFPRTSSFIFFFFLIIRRPPRSTLFPSTPLFRSVVPRVRPPARGDIVVVMAPNGVAAVKRSEEHTSELQSQSNLVCRLLLEKKKNKKNGLSLRLSEILENQL